MKNVIGVHFWEKSARICICDDYNIYTDAMELPMSIRNADVLQDEKAFRLAFEKIHAHMQENMGISGFDLVLTVPDDYGLREFMRLKKLAKSCDMELLRSYSESMCLAAYVNQEFRVENGVTILSAFVTEDRVGIAGYEMGDIVRCMETVLVTEQTGARGVLPYIQKAGPELLFRHMPDALFFTGSFNAGMTFEQAASAGLGRSDVDVKMLDAKCVIEGLGFLCGSLEQRPVAGLTDFRSVATPYPLAVSVNGEIHMYPKDQECPGESFSEPDIYPEKPEQSPEISLYEERRGKLFRIAGSKPDASDTDAFRKKYIRTGVHVDRDGTCSVILEETESGRKKFFILGQEEEAASAGAKEDNVATFVENILPIIDNLEYAARYAEDETNPYAQGIKQSYQKAVEILEKNGVTRITGEGEPFDFNLQNAVAHVADGDLPENTVKQVMQAGYMYRGKVLRPAQVIVAN